MAYVVKNADAEDKIKNEEPFRNRTAPDADGIPAWWGISGPAGVVGHLPREYWADAHAARYVVYSYATPIGWVRQDGTHIVPDVGYSPTTGQHQYAVTRAWHLPYLTARGRLVARPDATHVQYGRERRLRRGGMDGRGTPVNFLTEGSPDAMRWTPDIDQGVRL
jgi:hypothetical protein